MVSRCLQTQRLRIKGDFMQFVILAVGKDPMILNTRSLILRSAGYIVKSSTAIDEAVALTRVVDADLVLLCHSISEQERDWVRRAIRASGSRIPIYTVAPASIDFSPNLADGTLPNRPGDFLKSIKAALANLTR